jgi:hypothetical protein
MLLEFKIPILEEILPRSDKESSETKGNREVLIIILSHLFKKTMLMKGKR